jgi:pseudouridine synthase
MEIRLNKFLARRGVASRRGADRMIQEGRVAVNGRLVEELGFKIDDARDRVTVGGVSVKREIDFVYLAVNKPRGVLVTLRDPYDRAAIRELVPNLPPGVNPVGRLDKNSEGLLLLTNDGELAYRLTHPRYEIPKTYLVRIEGTVAPGQIAKLETGIVLEGKKTAPARIKVLESYSDKSVLLVEIHEGRKREVREMFKALGHEVIRLKRTSFGGLRLGRLPSGKWRPLRPDEVRQLKRSVGLK